jgi:hypothetical protein
MREKEIRPKEHVRIRKIDVADPQFGVLDLFIADLEARERSDVGRKGILSDSAAHPTRHHSGGVGLDARSSGRPEGQHRASGARIERDPNFHTVDVGVPVGMPIQPIPWIDRNDRIWGRRIGPIGENRLSAVDGLHQPYGALPEIVFDVGDVEDILSQHPDRAAPHVASADQEIDVLQWNARQGKGLDGGDGRIRPPATDSLHVEPERREARLELELSGARRAQGTVEGAAIDHELDLGSIDPCGHHRAHSVHRDRKLGHLAQFAFTVRGQRGRLHGAEQRQRRGPHTGISTQFASQRPCFSHAAILPGDSLSGQKERQPGTGSRNSTRP